MIEKDSKNLVVALKSFVRANSLPLDVYEVWDSLEEAKKYVNSPIAYPGQTLKIKTENNKYKTFILQKNEDGNLFLEDFGIEDSFLPSLENFKSEFEVLYENKRYEITGTPKGTLVDYNDKEIRVFCPENIIWTKQNVGANGNANMYYMGFKAYAPKNAVSFKEGDRGVVIDEMFTFEDKYAGIDKYGRKYSICWLALASYDQASDSWNYFGKNSSLNKYVGWTYIVEWYDENGDIISSDSIRINLSNESCHNNVEPYYVGQLNQKIQDSIDYTKQRIGEISEDMSVKTYVDTIIGDSSAEDLKEAKIYIDKALTIYEF